MATYRSIGIGQAESFSKKVNSVHNVYSNNIYANIIYKLSILYGNVQPNKENYNQTKNLFYWDVLELNLRQKKINRFDHEYESP